MEPAKALPLIAIINSPSPTYVSQDAKRGDDGDVSSIAVGHSARVMFNRSEFAESVSICTKGLDCLVFQW